MRISSISSNNLSKLKFQSKKNKPNSSDGNIPKSYQNNSPDVYFDSRFYSNVRDFINAKAGLSSGLMVVGEDGDVTPSRDLREYSDADKRHQIDLQASIRLKSIAMDAYQLGLPPKDLSEEIPSFVKFGADDYLNRIDAQIKVDESEFKSGSKKKSSGFSTENPEDLRGLKISLLLRKKDLQNSLELLTKANNYKIYQILMSAFDLNAGQVLLRVSDYKVLNAGFRVENDDDDLITCVYDTQFGVLKVNRDKNNFDYVSAKAVNFDGSEDFNLQFNKDGSIRSLMFSNSFGNSKVYIEQDNKSKIVTLACYQDGKLTSSRYALKNNKIVEIA